MTPAGQLEVGESTRLRQVEVEPVWYDLANAILLPESLNSGNSQWPSPTTHTVEYDPFIQSQLASRDSHQGLIRCKFGHLSTRNLGSKNLSFFTELMGFSTYTYV
jgi:hypothetical protein